MAEHKNRASPRQRPRAGAARVALALLVAMLSSALPAQAFDERIVYDPYSGLTIGGYDPVAYFTDGAARLGSPDFEVVVGDTYWHFVNAANAAAFKADPIAYVPAFGGYSLASLAKGIAAPGNPTLFVVRAGRVYLFASQAERSAFLAAPDETIAAATAAWPDVLRLLAY